MESSVFGTRLKEAMRKKDKYVTYNGKTKCTKKYTLEDLGKDTGYAYNTVTNWTKSNGSSPSFETVKELARFLNVDAAYLIGEQECQHNVDQTICDKTGLNETSAKVLSGLSDIETNMMNELLNNKDFVKLILFSWDYTHSHNKEVTITNTLDGSKDLPLIDDAQREMMKYRAVDVFGKILDNIYDKHLQDAMDAKIGSILVKLKKDIEPYLKYKDADEARQNLLGIVSYWQNEIKKIRPEQPICKLTPEQIIDNFDIIKDLL